MSDSIDLSQNQDGAELNPAAFELLERLRATLAEEYDVQRQLGEGGMAFVFLAKDIRHDRLVAIKVLKPDLASSIGSERFLREIKGAAKLSHPHILPMFDSGDADGLLYYVMPFVEGESLSDYLKREKQLSIEEAVQIAREVAEALSMAHSMGLVHRDIKPDNVMMTGGHAVVADFGIALALDQAGGEKLTQTGMAIGTPAYMSPEQSLAEAVDGRSDIYSLGCMMYEMLVGQIPFMAPTPMAMIAMHTTEYPTPVHVMRDSVPPELENIVFVAMEKTPADRFRTAQDMADALKAWEQGTAAQIRQSTAMKRVTTGMYGAPAVPRKKRTAIMGAAAVVVVLGGGLAIWQVASGGSGPGVIDIGGLDASNVAVLYFQDRSPDGSLGYIADGLTEGLIDNLSRVRGIDVISRNGVAPYSDPTISVDSVARALDVGTVVKGTVDQVADTLLQLSVRLFDGNSGADLGLRAGFTLGRARISEVQDSLAEAVTNLLRRALGEEVRLQELRASTNSMGAFALVQRAERLRRDARQVMFEDAARADEVLARADSVLAQAELADPTWAEPIVLRGWIAASRASLAHDASEADAWVDRGLQHAERALALDPGEPYAGAFELRGWLRYRGWFYGAEPEPDESARILRLAEEDLREAVRRDPSLEASAKSRLAFVLLETDPVQANLAAVDAYQADAYLENAYQLIWQLYNSNYELNNMDQARQWCERGHERFPAGPEFTRCQLQLFTSNRTPSDVNRAWELVEETKHLMTEEEWEQGYWVPRCHGWPR